MVTFTQFLQVLAFNLLSNTIPLCLLLVATAYLIIKMYEKRFNKIVGKEAAKLAGNMEKRKKQLTDED